MSDEDEPDRDDHPIIDRIIDSLEQDSDGRYQVASQASLEALLDDHLGSAELPFAVDAVIRLAHVLEIESDSPEAAMALCAAVERESVLIALRALVQEVQEERELVAGKGKDFRTFSETERRLAPQHDEPRSEGVVKLDAFKAPRRV